MTRLEIRGKMCGDSLVKLMVQFRRRTMRWQYGAKAILLSAMFLRDARQEIAGYSANPNIYGLDRWVVHRQSSSFAYDSTLELSSKLRKRLGNNGLLSPSLPLSLTTDALIIVRSYQLPYVICTSFPKR